LPVEGPALDALLEGHGRLGRVPHDVVALLFLRLRELLLVVVLFFALPLLLFLVVVVLILLVFVAGRLVLSAAAGAGSVLGRELERSGGGRRVED
jgi:uncharacterized membrane protein